MNTQKIGWQIIIWVLTVESWELFNLRLENTRLVNVNDWTVQKAYYMNLSCKTIPSFKIPIVQVRRRFKLIQYLLNSQYSLRKLNEKSRKTGVYIHLFFSFKNSNSSNMTLQNIRLLNKNNYWTITLLSHIPLYTKVLVFLYRYQSIIMRKTSYSKKKNSSYKIGINCNEENKLFNVQKTCVLLKYVFLYSWFKIFKV